MLADALPRGEIVKRLWISGQTYHRWRNQDGGMNGPKMKRLKRLKKELHDPDNESSPCALLN